MPAKSPKQRRFIFAKRNQYGSKKKTPKSYKWVWDYAFLNKAILSLNSTASSYSSD